MMDNFLSENKEILKEIIIVDKGINGLIERYKIPLSDIKYIGISKASEEMRWKTKVKNEIMGRISAFQQKKKDSTKVYV